MTKDMIGNVIKHDEFKQIMRETFQYVADVVSETLGPHGHNTIVQSVSGIYSTKDGWNTLQNINFGGDVTRNAIKFMIESVAQSIVLTVGDGSTTSTIAANALSKFLDEHEPPELTTIKSMEQALTRCVNKLVSQLYSSAEVVNAEDPFNDIYKIALVSTNWDEELANMIASIYATTLNPIIKVVDSGTDKTSVEYIEGYDLAGSLLLPEYYANDREHAKAVMGNPVILVFSHNVQEKMFMTFSCIAQRFNAIGRPLVIAAPGFETAFLNKLSAVNNSLIKQRSNIVSMIPCKLVCNYENDKDCIRDFCKLTGANFIAYDDSDFAEFVRDVADVMFAKVPDITDDTDEETRRKVEEVKVAQAQMANSILEYIGHIGGTCEELSIDGNGLLAKGLPNVDDLIINDTRSMIKGEIDRKIKECDALTILTDDIRMKRVRLGKLACKMGIIKVGGYGSANLKAKRDALDDATRACEAAYRDGYNRGGCLSILSAIENVVRSEDEAGSLTDLDAYIFDAIRVAFTSVFTTLFKNKYGLSLEELENRQFIVYHGDVENELMDLKSIINHCLEQGCGFDLLDNTFDTECKIVNPVNVDVEALKACLRLVIISVTSSQFIYKYYAPDTSSISLKEVK